MAILARPVGRTTFVTLLVALSALVDALPASAGGRHAGGAFWQPHWVNRSSFARNAPQSGIGMRLAVSSAGQLWAMGSVRKFDGIYTVLRMSPDTGATWTTKAEVKGYPVAFALDGSDRLYILGTYSGYDLQLKKSSDEGATWSTITLPAPVSSFDWTDFAVSPDGNTIYLAGTDGTSSNYPWIVKKSINGGASWTTMDVFYPPTREMDLVSRIAVNWTNGTIWVVGAGYDLDWNMQWYVRKSPDSGATWSTSDMRTGGAQGRANDIAWDGSGNIYVVGEETDSSWDNTYWMVSRSSDDGATWTTVDYHLGPETWAAAQSIAIAPGGSIFVGGVFWRSAALGDFWAVRKSTDGTAWATVDTYQSTAPQDAEAQGLAISGTDLFVIGRSIDIASTNHWVVRRSADQGATFEVSDDFAPVGPRSTAVKNALMDAAGTLYLSGALDWQNAFLIKSADGGLSWSENLDPTVYNESHYYAALALHPGTGALYSVGQREFAPNGAITIRKSTDGGSTWSSVSTINSMASSFLIAPNGDLYLLLDNTWASPRRWILQRSQDDGQTWTVVDDYANTNCAARSIAHGPGGFFAAGYCNLDGQPTRWTVRKSADGTTWTSVDSYLHAAGKNSEAHWVTVLADGVVLVSGTGIDATNKRHALIRRSADGGSTWTTVDDYLPPSTSSVIARGFAVDVSGRIYTAGYSQVASEVWHVRASADGGLTWRNSDRYVPGSVACQAAGLVASPVDVAVYAVGYSGSYNSGTKALIRRMR